MKLNHLLVDGIQAERETEIKSRHAAAKLISAKATTQLRSDQPTNLLRRLILAF